MQIRRRRTIVENKRSFFWRSLCLVSLCWIGLIIVSVVVIIKIWDSGRVSVEGGGVLD